MWIQLVQWIIVKELKYFCCTVITLRLSHTFRIIFLLTQCLRWGEQGYIIFRDNRLRCVFSFNYYWMLNIQHKKNINKFLFSVYIYIYGLCRHFYPKRLTVHSGHTFVNKGFKNIFCMLNWCRDNEGIAHIWPWNGFRVNCPITYGSLKKGLVHIKEM